MSSNALAAKSAPSRFDNTSASDLLKKKESQDLIIGLCGPVGSGIKEVVSALAAELKSNGYHVEHIRISALFMDATIQSNAESAKSILESIDGTCESSRIGGYQLAGNKLREELGSDICAQLAIQEISLWRQINIQDSIDADASRRKTAFIIDQLKHPSEAAMLKRLYGDIFYLIGLLTAESEKIKRLKNRGISEEDTIRLINTDKKQDINHGQQLEKTLVNADYYLAFHSEHLPRIEKNIKRLVDLIHGANGLTPTSQEVGMYAAYSASLGSACLSRQVGAAICDDKGHILATGKNDVPEYGGGLYSADSENDLRCIHKGGKCYNTTEINLLKDSITKLLTNDFSISLPDARSIADSIQKNTKVGSLIEFSRSIHAEMDAIVSLARSPTQSPVGKILYTTTYPCHNCARHIVAAGIERVIYIEPYAKSLAIKLHDDAISDDQEVSGKVIISPFEGVSPNKYQSFFVADGERKDRVTGTAVRQSTKDLLHISRVIVSSYVDTETQITDRLHALFSSRKGNAPTIIPAIKKE